MLSLYTRAPARPRGAAAPTRLDGSSPDAQESLPEAVAGLRAGDQVRHKSYGVGTVERIEGSGRSTTAHVTFTVDGAPATKRLILRLAPMERI